MSEETPRRARPGFHWRWVAFGLAGAVLLVLLLEGLLSFWHLGKLLAADAQSPPVAIRLSGHDRELGWRVDGGLHERDAFGTWVPLNTDDDGFRDSADDGSGDAPRLLCLGGSQTYGVGVGDQGTWCGRLAMAGDLRPANMAQPGYAPDQSLMIYRGQDTGKGDVVVLALEPSSVRFLVRGDYLGFGKPRLVESSGGLEVAGVPVPVSSYVWPWFTTNRGLFASSHLLSAVGLARTPQPEDSPAALKLAVIVDGIIHDFAARTEKNGAKPVVVYLPRWRRLADDGGLRKYFRATLNVDGLTYLDLAGAADALTPAQRAALFDDKGYLSGFGQQWLAHHVAVSLASADILPASAGRSGPWRARYYSDRQFGKQAGRANPPILSLDWGMGPPLDGMPADNFSAVFESCMVLDKPARFDLLLEARGNAQLSVNQQTVLDTGDGDTRGIRRNTVAFPAGVNLLRVRYTDKGGWAAVRLALEDANGRVRSPGAGLLQAPNANGVCVR